MRKTFFLASLILIFASACNTSQATLTTPTPDSTPTIMPTPTPTQISTPTPPPLFLEGSLIISVDDEYYIRLTENLSMETVENPNDTSPNGRFTLHIEYKNFTPDSLVLYDLESKEEKSPIKGAPYCIQWAPDSQSFSYKLSEPGLYIYDISTGSQKLVYEAPSALYHEVGSPSTTTTGQPNTIRMYGKLDCGTWVGNDALLFQRYTGEMPSVYSEDAVAANTTTLAMADQEVILIDAPRRFYVIDVSYDGTTLLMEDDEGADYVTSPFENFEEMNLRRIELDSQISYRFIPNSNQIFFEGLDANYFINPETFQIDASPAFMGSPDGCVSHQEKVWVTHPKNGTLACVSDDGAVQLVNRITGQVIQLLSHEQISEHLGFSSQNSFDITIVDWTP